MSVQVKYAVHVLIGVVVCELVLSTFRVDPPIVRCDQFRQDGDDGHGDLRDTTGATRQTVDLSDKSQKTIQIHSRVHAGSTLASRHSYLSIARPLYPLSRGDVFTNYTPAVEKGFALAIPPDTTRICVDVGTFIHSPTSRHWWMKDPNTFIIAVEPNPFSEMLMSRLAHPLFMDSVNGYWPTMFERNSTRRRNQTFRCSGGELTDCIQKTWWHITENFHRFLLLPMAAGATDSMSTFQLGTPGRPDSGSLLSFRQAFMKKRNLKKVDWVTTAIGKLEDVLRVTPAFLNNKPLLWDTLKIDAQGFDAAVVKGAGDFIAHFACVIGEFDKRSYAGGPKIDYYSSLVYEYGFAMVTQSIWINRRFEAAVMSKQALCSVTDVVVHLSKVKKTLAKYNAMFGVWTDDNSALLLKNKSKKLTTALADMVSATANESSPSDEPLQAKAVDTEAPAESS